MPLLKDLVDAQFPVVAITTDDTLNIQAALASILGVRVAPFKPADTLGDNVYYSLNVPIKDTDIKKFYDKEKTLILVNFVADTKNPAIYDAGEMPTPVTLVKDKILHVFKDDEQSQILKAVDGLSYLRIQQLVSLAEHKGLPRNYQSYKNLRMSLYGMDEGLYPVIDTGELYEWDTKFKEWAESTMPYLTSGSSTLSPRGVLLHGPAGTGKTSATKALSRLASVPAYRLDIGASLSKWQGESEAQIRKHLAFIEAEAPCILLIDEIEKVITTSDENRSSRLILAHLLWWLSEHRARVFTVMTSNNIEALPLELYRSGRCDKVFKIGLMNKNRGVILAKDWFTLFLRQNDIKITPEQRKQAYDSFNKQINKSLPAAEITEITKGIIRDLQLTLNRPTITIDSF